MYSQKQVATWEFDRARLICRRKPLRHATSGKKGVNSPVRRELLPRRLVQASQALADNAAQGCDWTIVQRDGPGGGKLYRLERAGKLPISQLLVGKRALAFADCSVVALPLAVVEFAVGLEIVSQPLGYRQAGVLERKRGLVPAHR